MEYNIDYFVKLEEELMKGRISEMCSTSDICYNLPSDKQINEMYKAVHGCFVYSLIVAFLSDLGRRCNKEDVVKYLEGDYEILDFVPKDLDIDIIPQICEELHILYLNSSFSYKNGKYTRKKSKVNLIETGSVYTPSQIAHEIVSYTLANVKNSVQNLASLKLLDFAVGTGRFYREVVRVLNDKYGVVPDVAILNCIYAVDIDSVAVNISRLWAFSMLQEKSLSNAHVISMHIICRNALLKDALFSEGNAVKRSDADGLFYGGFDAIVSNPPYLVLKPNAKKMEAEMVESINNMVSYFKQSPYYKYSVEGMLNLYQLSLEAMIGMLKDHGEMGIICPSTLFADISASKLRRFLLLRNSVTHVKYFSEDDPMFQNVTQATCIFHLTKGKSTSSINIEQGGKNYVISLDDVQKVFSKNLEIPSVDKTEWNILRKLNTMPRLKNVTSIRNKRGELDLSLFKNYITTSPTPYRLVRGNMIRQNGIDDVNHEYVMSEFLEKKSTDYKSHDLGHVRLICQQISNQTQKKRLNFVFCEKTDILGNSCNYISSSEENLKLIGVVLNSALLNWRFKITSTNNHINNYELDELPIINIKELPADIFQVSNLDREKIICRLYGLTEEETQFIIRESYEII